MRTLIIPFNLLVQGNPWRRKGSRSGDEDYNDEDYTPEPETASKRQKRHTPEQIRELIA